MFFNPILSHSKKAGGLILSMLILIFAFLILPPSAALANGDVIGENPFIGEIPTPIGTLTFENNGYPTLETIEKLYNEMDFQRATQLYLWSLPMVSMAQWQAAHEETFGVSSGEFVNYQSFLDKLGILTANDTTPYIISFFDLDETGPLVVKFPGGMSAGLIDIWQRPIARMGPCQGEYHIYGPGQELVSEESSVQGPYIKISSTTNNIFFGLRSYGEEDIDQFFDELRIYPLHGVPRNHPPELIDVNKFQVPWSQVPPRGVEYWKRLAKIIAREPVQERDRLFMAMLKPLGIEKVAPNGTVTFAPEERQKEILNKGAELGEAMARVNDFQKRIEAANYNDEVHWEYAALILNPNQRAEYYDQLDERAAWFYEAVTISDQMVSKTEDPDGQVYLAAYKDGDGNWLDGSNSYKLTVPANPPASKFWSLTVYDNNARVLIDNDTEKPDFSCWTDGTGECDFDPTSDYIYVGPQQPDDETAHWIKTNPGEGWFAYFRLYGPENEFFDGPWVLHDFVKQ